MIKKFLHSIIAFFVLVSTMGFTLDFHYCQGNLYSVNIDSSTHSCNMDNMCHSCSDLSVKVKITDNYLVSSAITANHQLPVTTLNLPVITRTKINTVTASDNLETYHSPPSNKGDIHTFTHSFLC